MSISPEAFHLSKDRGLIKWLAKVLRNQRLRRLQQAHDWMLALGIQEDGVVGEKVLETHQADSQTSGLEKWAKVAPEVQAAGHTVTLSQPSAGHVAEPYSVLPCEHL